MAITGKREFHPAMVLYFITLVLASLTVLCGFIALFVPWVQKDIAPGTRVYAYPFKTCYVSTFSTVHQESCLDNDIIVGPKGAPVSGGNDTCKIFVLVSVSLGFVGIFCQYLITFVLMAVMWKLWSRPVRLAVTAQVVIVLVPCFLICSWSIFIAYAEMTCHAKSIFPVRGYSYGFVLMLFSTACALSTVVTGFIALKKLRRYQPLQLDEEKDVYLEETSIEGGEAPVEGVEELPLAAPTPVASETHTPVVMY